MSYICQNSKDGITVTKAQVIRAIKHLKNGKALDSHNLGAEHLKLLPENAAEALVWTFQKIVEERKIPKSLKLAYKLMIPKPGKDSRLN
jgi:hypothetical protein